MTSLVHHRGPHLSHSLAGGRVVLLVVQVGEVACAGQPLQQLRLLDVQLCEEALCTCRTTRRVNVGWQCLRR